LLFSRLLVSLSSAARTRQNLYKLPCFCDQWFGVARGWSAVLRTRRLVRRTFQVESEAPLESSVASEQALGQMRLIEFGANESVAIKCCGFSDLAPFYRLQILQ